MKKYLLLSILLCLSYLSKAQYYNQLGYINFQTPVDTFIAIDTTAGNIWQIGKPRKAFFDSGYAGPKAMVTDTLNPYPVNNTSSFTVKLPGPWSPRVNQSIYFAFTHKYNTDSLKDGGYLQLSLNNKNWFFITSDFNPVYDSTISIYDLYYNGAIDVRMPDDTIKSIQAFTGKSLNRVNGWEREEIFECSGFLPGDADTLYFKFVFKSDSIQTNKEGWMIGNITWGSDICEGVEIINPNAITLYPNPATDNVNITLPTQSAFSVYNIMGQLVYSESAKNRSGDTQLSILHYPNGVYVVKTQTGSNAQTVKFVVEH